MTPPGTKLQIDIPADPEPPKHLAALDQSFCELIRFDVHRGVTITEDRATALVLVGPRFYTVPADWLRVRLAPQTPVPAGDVAEEDSGTSE